MTKILVMLEANQIRDQLFDDKVVPQDKDTW